MLKIFKILKVAFLPYNVTGRVKKSQIVWNWALFNKIVEWFFESLSWIILKNAKINDFAIECDWKCKSFKNLQHLGFFAKVDKISEESLHFVTALQEAELPLYVIGTVSIPKTFLFRVFSKRDEFFNTKYFFFKTPKVTNLP